MRKLNSAKDFNERSMHRGDIVTVLSDRTAAKICDIARDDEATFVRICPLHQAYGKGIWHAADQVVWVSAARRPPKQSTMAKGSAWPKTTASRR